MNCIICCRKLVSCLFLVAVFAFSFTESPARLAAASEPGIPVPVQEEEATSTTDPPNIDREALLFDGEVPQTIEELRMMEQHVAKLAERVKPAVVNIQMAGAQGSGVVVSSDGYILTAAHVIGRPNRTATITFPDGKKVKATTLGSERRIDSGILKINDDEGSDFPYVDMGLSDELTDGQWLVAIGHPGGIDPKRGLVVRMGRLIQQTNSVLRTDCTLVGGDSGGPLFDMNGDVIGIHSRIGAHLWNNLHVPVDTYSENWDELIAGYVVDGQPTLGFSVIDDTNEVKSVTANSASAKAGLKVGDVIKKIESSEVEDRDDIRSAVRKTKPNQKIKMIVQRGDEEITLNVTVGGR